MNTVIAIVVDVTAMDAGRRAAVMLRTNEGRSIYLYVDNTGNSLLEATMKGAMAHEDQVEIGFEPSPPRLGAPLGVIRTARIIGYETEIGHAA